ncbi:MULTISPECIES: bacteriophage antitermination protein Q [Citrobacter freundii complex]|uniref:bacteriophage antitermination protein Q n=1 Tax=Citrobacter freundii complex TaxID=1344959 RepID=UPI000CDCAB76|nr:MULTISPECIES: bacteriophage antitermination protein Q [Citrobacter freundii complex]AUZ69868.1 antiterminator [Citrobacter freundii complex sp. CFNIH4]POU14087.1 antiterminator [Citrobacter freundii complex sp. CFNIH6]POU15775.1 antiterminator [Citrobacter freundii complex sp. CFNIH7]QLR82491.1 antiterminator [Citrobacter freundii]HCB1465061.1 antiterminator [Citrobacter freundii]
MNTQFLEYVRQQLIVATADLSGATKGQLMAWLENAQFDTGTFKRKKMKVRDEVTGEMITLDNPPIPGKQSHAKGSHIPLVQPVEYSTASWRRALMTLEEHQKAWLLWNYSENVRWCYQVEITQWGWQQFSQQLAGKRVAKKTIDRLRQLIWLAAQDVKAELAGRETYEYQAMAELAGVAKSTWTETYLPHWLVMRNSFKRLDSGALISVTRSRSQQKATNSQASLAKPN